MSWTTVADVVAAICLLGGALLAFAAGVGLVRFGDLLARMHSATKPQVLGLILVLVGLALRVRSGPAVWMLVLVAAFQLLTSPVASHMVGRAGYRTGKVRSERLVVDELTADQDAAEREAVAHEGAARDRREARAAEAGLAERAPRPADREDTDERHDRAGDDRRGGDLP